MVSTPPAADCRAILALGRQFRAEVLFSIAVVKVSFRLRDRRFDDSVAPWCDQRTPLYCYVSLQRGRFVVGQRHLGVRFCQLVANCVQTAFFQSKYPSSDEKWKRREVFKQASRCLTNCLLWAIEIWLFFRKSASSFEPRTRASKWTQKYKTGAIARGRNFSKLTKSEARN